MAFPSPDPTWIFEIFKVIALFALGGILLYRWLRAERRFYTDLPFLFAWGFFFVAGGEIIDALFHSEFFPVYTLVVYKIRALLPAISLLFFLYATTLIWFVDNPRWGQIISLVYIILYIVLIAFVPTAELLLILSIPFLLIVYFVFAGSFLLAWIMKRLPDVHGLLICVGGAVTMMGQVSKTFFAALGIGWAAEFVDLLGLIILWGGLFIKPGYARTQAIPEY